MAVQVKGWVTGCGDAVVTGFGFHATPTRGEIRSLKEEFLRQRDLAYSSQEFENSGIIYVAFIFRERNKEWVKELRKLGFRVAPYGMGINSVHSHDTDPMMLMYMNSGRVSEEVVSYWKAKA